MGLFFLPLYLAFLLNPRTPLAKLVRRPCAPREPGVARAADVLRLLLLHPAGVGRRLEARCCDPGQLRRVHAEEPGFGRAHGQRVAVREAAVERGIEFAELAQQLLAGQRVDARVRRASVALDDLEDGPRRDEHGQVDARRLGGLGQDRDVGRPVVGLAGVGAAQEHVPVLRRRGPAQRLRDHPHARRPRDPVRRRRVREVPGLVDAQPRRVGAVGDAVRVLLQCDRVSAARAAVRTHQFQHDARDARDALPEFEAREQGPMPEMVARVLQSREVDEALRRAARRPHDARARRRRRRRCLQLAPPHIHLALRALVRPAARVLVQLISDALDVVCSALRDAPHHGEL